MEIDKSQWLLALAITSWDRGYEQEAMALFERWVRECYLTGADAALELDQFPINPQTAQEYKAARLWYAAKRFALERGWRQQSADSSCRSIEFLFLTPERPTEIN